MAVLAIAAMLFACGGSQHLYVSSSSLNSVATFSLTANGNVTPAATIIGANTGLTHPNGIAFDASSKLYVANGTANTVTVYVNGASGNATPTATIIGANTGLAVPSGIA
jgi:6-phosphogluconolactonase (cycloisomerase 2 family)